MKSKTIYSIFATIVVGCSLIANAIQHKQIREYEDLCSFKTDLIFKQWDLIDSQDSLINNLEDHLWYEHDCDIPIMDGQEYERMIENKTILDSIYNTQL